MLDENFKDPPSIHDLADVVDLSSSRLAHLFRAEVGRSIRSYLVERRLQMAALIIAEGDERISQIAYRVGFNDISNFNHSFKRRFGVSPSQHRAAHDRGHTDDSET